MKLLSIDVGIKNLSLCLFDITESLKIVKWDIINLSEKNESRCVEIDKNGLCDKPAKFSKNGQCYCLKHSKKHNFLQPTAEFKTSFLNKQKLQTLVDIAEKHQLTYEKPARKAGLLQTIGEFIKEKCFEPVEKTNATKVDLVTIGKNIMCKLDDLLGEHLDTIDNIIIENQIGPLANKMCTIQGMLSQYFVMRNNNVQINFISACNKLKDFLPNEKTDYKQRKKLSVQVALSLVKNDFRFKEWEIFFVKHAKKDDLSDCLLQGLWYVNHNSL